MASKQDLIKNITKETYTASEVKHLITSVSTYDTISGKHINKVFKGDVFMHESINKKRPFVVIKVIKGVSLFLSMSTTEDYMNLEKFNCRQFGEGFFNLNVVIMDNGRIKKNFVGVMSDKKSLCNAIKFLKFTLEKI